LGYPTEKSIEAVKAFVVKKDPNITAQDIIKFASTQLTKLQGAQARRVPCRIAEDQCRQDLAP